MSYFFEPRRLQRPSRYPRARTAGIPQPRDGRCHSERYRHKADMVRLPDVYR